MTYFRYAFVLMAFFVLSACSDDNPVEINENTATKIYNEIKGTYEGYVRVGNDSHPVTIVVANINQTVVSSCPLNSSDVSSRSTFFTRASL